MNDQYHKRRRTAFLSTHQALYKYADGGPRRKYAHHNLDYEVFRGGCPLLRQGEHDSPQRFRRWHGTFSWILPVSLGPRSTLPPTAYQYPSLMLSTFHCFDGQLKTLLLKGKLPAGENGLKSPLPDGAVFRTGERMSKVLTVSLVD